jgi:hypothetical protein
MSCSITGVRFDSVSVPLLRGRVHHASRFRGSWLGEKHALEWLFRHVLASLLCSRDQDGNGYLHGHESWQGRGTMGRHQ